MTSVELELNTELGEGMSSRGSGRLTAVSWESEICSAELDIFIVTGFRWVTWPDVWCLSEDTRRDLYTRSVLNGLAASTGTGLGTLASVAGGFGLVLEDNLGL